MPAYPIDGDYQGERAIGTQLPALVQPPSIGGSQTGRAFWFSQIGKPADVLTSGVVQIPVMSDGIISPSTMIGG